VPRSKDRSQPGGRAERHAIAVDLGGTYLRVACVTGAGELLHRQRIATPAGGEPEVVIPAIERLVGAARDAVADSHPIGLGVAAPGPLDPRRGIVIGVPNLVGWHEVPLAEILARQLDMTVWLHNDANLAGLGEARFGAGRGFDPLLYLTVSTGIGGGIICGGRIYEGAHGLAGELGHVIVADGGPACNFGHRGCLEALASGTGIARRARERLEAVATQQALPPTRPQEPITAESVAGAAGRGDVLSREIYERAGWSLGIAIGGHVNAFDPARVVIGGGVSRSWHLIEPAMLAGVAAVAMAWDRRAIDIVPARFGDDAGLIGAAVHAFDCSA
jgi:glucokinase